MHTHTPIKLTSITGICRSAGSQWERTVQDFSLTFLPIIQCDIPGHSNWPRDSSKISTAIQRCRRSDTCYRTTLRSIVNPAELFHRLSYGPFDVFLFCYIRANRDALRKVQSTAARFEHAILSQPLHHTSRPPLFQYRKPHRRGYPPTPPLLRPLSRMTQLLHFPGPVLLQ